MQWILPTAPENRDAMQRAWYSPTRLSPFASSRPELDDPEDEEGMLRSVKSVEALIDELTGRGVPPDRIVLGGFSQGHAVTMLAGLTSAKAQGLAGLVCLSGYLPLEGRIQGLRARAGLAETVGMVSMFVVRGMKDMLVPKRYHRMQMEKLEALGVEMDGVEVKEYEGLGHSTCAEEIRDLCTWLEKVVPALE